MTQAVTTHNSRTQRIVQVDAFTDTPFAGNPAAVCVLDAPTNEQWMQQVAAEMNLSETAFLVPQTDGYQLRWFTPAVEVDLCGHATLASAHVLWTEGHLSPDREARFHTRSGLLTANQRGNWIELNFPLQPVEASAAPPELPQALGVAAVYVGRNAVNYLVEVQSEEVLRSLQPDFDLLRRIPEQGVIVTCRSETSPYDFLSRYFAPNAGIDEDPVTGSAHCTLAPYWQERLGKSEFLAYQASARGGVLKVRCGGDRVYIGGRAVTVLRGELLVPPVAAQ
jgi:PhzF family phenazine biosynthesis protein